MTWRDEDTNAGREGIAECREIAARHDDQAVVIVRVGRDGVVRVSTWGEAGRKCKAIGVWGQSILGEGGLSVVPFRTVFGWGNGGVPKPLSKAERAGMTDREAAWVRKLEGRL